MEVSSRQSQLCGSEEETGTGMALLHRWHPKLQLPDWPRKASDREEKAAWPKHCIPVPERFPMCQPEHVHEHLLEAAPCSPCLKRSAFWLPTSQLPCTKLHITPTQNSREQTSDQHGLLKCKGGLSLPARQAQQQYMRQEHSHAH